MVLKSMNILELLPKKVLSEMPPDLSITSFHDDMEFLRMQVEWYNETPGNLLYVDCKKCKN